MDRDLLVFNGIDATTGAYLQSLMSVSEASLLARGEAVDPAHVAELKARRQRESQRYYGPSKVSTQETGCDYYKQLRSLD